MLQCGVGWHWQAEAWTDAKHLVSQRSGVPALFMTEFARRRIYIQHILPVVFLCRAVLHSHTLQSPHELRWSDDPVSAALSPEKNESHPWSWVMHSLRALSRQWAAWLCSRHEASCVTAKRRPLQMACCLSSAYDYFSCDHSRSTRVLNHFRDFYRHDVMGDYTSLWEMRSVHFKDNKKRRETFLPQLTLPFFFSFFSCILRSHWTHYY